MAWDVTFGVAALALLFEAAFGYPQFLVARIGHPVIWFGRLIGLIDRTLNDDDDAPASRRMAGVLGLVLLLGVVGVPVLALEHWLLAWPFGIFPVAVLASSLLAQRSLYEHVERVANGLEESLEAGREAVSHIVGRDPQALDETGVVRGAIESLAENFSDGIVAPALWTALGGLTGGALYKAINTADSMIGHRNRRYGEFGWASARLDDLVNLPASRLSGALIIAAALFVRGASPRAGWQAMRRDASHHRSPNAGWPEAAMAGALGIAIGGPRAYGGKIADIPFMGRDGRRELTAADIRRALQLYRVADGLLIAGAILVFIVIAAVIV